MAEEIKPPERPHPETGSGGDEERTSSHSRSLLVRWMGIADANSGGFIHGGTVMRLVDEAAGLPRSSTPVDAWSRRGWTG